MENPRTGGPLSGITVADSKQLTDTRSYFPFAPYIFKTKSAVVGLSKSA